MDIVSRLLLDIQGEYKIPSIIFLLAIIIIFWGWKYYENKRANSNDKSLKITAGEKSNNIQLNEGNYIDGSNRIASSSAADTYNFQGSIIQLGPSEDAIKALCRELMADNFTKLRDEALQTVNDRVDEFITLFLPIVDIKSSLHVKNLKNPSMQNAIYLAQRAYVLNGELNQAYLIELLQEKLNTNDNELKQILLSEAIDKLGLITSNQIEALRILLEMTFMRPKNSDLESIISYYEKVINDLKLLSITNMDIAHLLYTGCVFSYGVGITAFSGFLETTIESNNIKLNDDNDYESYVAGNPGLKEMEIIWNNHPLSHLSLNSVGRIIALSQWNLKNKDNKFNYDCLF
ncbi:LPO_1073/Vpar_1526 family protein [Veillonella sp. AF13-2]|uniref:LPO_1073/Vpar_1526 family protein n=1 Tax=Veillonella sp. AF13-2 TaxID=2293250 RepID=UPI000ED13757|nr:LPO_1073/Vpar_1526 family protein [Veillonella sp. AF13-2]RJV50130.1 hypothetical protein DWV85_04180 [Veillonella sp. AF13-2]